MGDFEITLSLQAESSLDTSLKLCQLGSTSNSIIAESSNCTMTNTMPTTTTTILTNVHPSTSSAEDQQLPAPPSSTTLVMTPTSTATFADCVAATTGPTMSSADDSTSLSATSVLLNGTLGGSANSLNTSVNNGNVSVSVSSVVGSVTTNLDNLDIKLPSSTEVPKSPELRLSSPSPSMNNGVSPTILIPPPSGSSCGFPTHTDHSSGLAVGSGGSGSVGGNSGNSGGAGTPMWSNVDDGSHMSMNGYGNYQNFANSPIFNGASASSIAAAISQHNRRAITANHGGGFQPHSGQHALSPNSMNRSPSMMQSHSPQPQQQPPKQNSGFQNNYPQWSNPPPPPSVSWQGQGQPGQNMQSWNRGRSVPNLNPMNNVLPNRKPTSPNPGLSPSAFSSTQQNSVISPVKYRRSTSFPGKVQGQSVGGAYQGPGPLDVSVLEDGRDPFMQYQVTMHTIKDSICLFSVFVFLSFSFFLW